LTDGFTAQDKCETGNGNLATVQSEAENIQLRSMLTPDRFWIGFNDLETEGVWEWYSGRDVSYTNWSSGEPSGHTETDNCAHIKEDGRWDDADCPLSSYPYVCEITLLNLTCSIEEGSTDADADGDDITYTFDWDVDGTPYTDTDSSTHDGDTVPAEALGTDETWTCTVTPDDGEDDGPADADSYYIEGEPESFPDCSSITWGLGTYHAEDFITSYPSRWTLEGWFNPTGNYTGSWGGGFVGLPAVEICGGHTDYHMVVGATGTVDVHGWKSRATSGNTSSWTAGEWFHFAIQFNGDSTGTLWVDGEQAQTFSGLSMPNADCPMYFGNRRGSSMNYADGSLASLRFSTGARYSESFTPQATMDDDGDTVWLFNFDEGSGGTASAESGATSFSMGPLSWSDDGPECGEEEAGDPLSDG